MANVLTDEDVGLVQPLSDQDVGLSSSMMDRAKKVWDSPTPGSLVDIVKAGYNAFMAPGRAMSGELSMTDENGRTSMDAVGAGVDFARSAPMGGMPSVAGRMARPAPSTQAVKSAADAGYTAARGVDLTIRPQSVRNLGNDIATELNTRGLDSDVAPSVNAIISKLQNATDDGYVTGASLINLRTKLNNLAGQTSDGKPTQEAAAAMAAKSKLSGYFTEKDVLSGDFARFSQVLGEADKNLAASSVANAVDRQIAKAELRAASTNSGENVGNTIRQNLRRVMEDPSKMRSLTPAEQAQISRVVEGNSLENAGRWVGNKAGSAFGWVAGAAGAPFTGYWSLLPPAIGSAARAGVNMSTQRQAQILSDMVRSRSPLGMTQSVEDAFAARFPKQVAPGLLGQVTGPQAASRYGLLGYPQFGPMPVAADYEQQY